MNTAVTDSLITETDTLRSGLTTSINTEPEEGPVGLTVSWIAWDSGFRDTGLQIDDRITHVNDIALEPLLLPGQMQALPGQSGEPMGWEKSGAQAGDLIQLKVWRPTGECAISGKLLSERLYRDAKDKSAMAPGGPERLAADGFEEVWSSWYDKLIWKCSQILEGSWQRARLNTRKELAELLETGPRITRLRELYPGPFADRVQQDWMRALESLRGKKFDDVDLSYRELGQRRVEQTKKLANQDWDAFKQFAADQLVPAFPQHDLNDREAVVGKWVELPWISNRNIVNDLGLTWAVAEGNSNEYYVARLTDAPEFKRLYGAIFRFQALVQPNLSERYQYIGEITDTPAMITFQNRTITAYQIRLVAARAGSDGECFVDVRAQDSPGHSSFAGEAAMVPIGIDEIKDDATPAEVLTYMTGCVKRADEKGWRCCFADWRASQYTSGQPCFSALYAPGDTVFSQEWEKSRRLIQQDVYDVRIDRVTAPRTLFAADSKTGIPAVEQVIVYLDHIGKFDDEFRTYNHFTLTRRCVLQRVNQGPWRLSEVQSF